MAAPGKTRICPICDAQVPAGARNCPSCSTDLSLFDVPVDASSVTIQNKDNVDQILAELEKGEKDKALQGLKTIGTDQAGQPRKDAAGSQVIEVFQCPECGADVPNTSDTCPKCGVMFAPADMFQCPLCNAVIDATTTICPGCGAQFEDAAAPPPTPPAQEKAAPPASKPAAQPVSAPPKAPEPSKPSPAPKPAPVEKKPEPAPEQQMSFVDRMKMLRAQKEGGTQPAMAVGQSRPPTGTATPAQPKPTAPGEMKSLPQMVGKIKEDFALAKKLNIDITGAKETINKAVTAGRDKDLKTAVQLVQQGEAEVERAFTGFITRELVAMEKQAKDVQSSGIDVGNITSLLARVRQSSNGRRWVEAITALDAARGSLNTLASEYFEAQKGLTGIRSVIDDATSLKIDLGEGRTLYEDCLKATVRKDWDTAKMLAEQCTEHFNKILPGYIANEMRKAKTKLLEVKMMNVSITKPVGFLKDANTSIKNNDYGGALHSIRLFRDAMNEVDRIKPA